MMLDDQGMAEEWIVRVQGKEYGPANIDTLREWKREGRLLPENEARNMEADLWSTAAKPVRRPLAISALRIWMPAT